jgi:branched-chain amino acid transport system permease protein
MFKSLGIIPLVAIPVAMVLGMALGFLFYYTVMKKILKAPEMATLLATFSLGVILEETMKQIFTSESWGYNWSLGKLDLGVTVLPYTKIMAFAGSIIIALLLYMWFNKTRAGMAVRCVVEDDEGARVCGINVDWGSD